MASDKRVKVRPVAQTSTADKVFKPLVSVAKKARIPKDHPWVVLGDLRRGSLMSLDRYLAKHGGIADRAIAVELRKLIAGSASRARFRLLVVEHPGRKNKGGRPQTRNRAPTTTELEIAERYESQEHFGKTAAAVGVALTAKPKRSAGAVRKARDRVREHIKRVAIEEERRVVADQQRADGQGRRQAALQSARAAGQRED